jgi:uncharacterized protein YwgA
VSSLKREDWLLLLLGLRSDEATHVALDPVRVQKGMFLLSQESDLPPEEKYDFRPYNWGPYSRELRRDLNRLVSEGLIAAHEVAGYSWQNYGLTELGVKVARQSLLTASRAGVALLVDIRKRVSKVSFAELLEDVYSKYPQYAVNSLFRA